MRMHADESSVLDMTPLERLGWALVVAALILIGAQPTSPAEKPYLTLRGPVATFVGQRASFIGEVKGDDAESFYCVKATWDFKDGTVSAHEEDCDPWQAGDKVERFYTKGHVFKQSGEYAVELTLERGKRVVARRAWSIRIMTAGGENER